MTGRTTEELLFDKFAAYYDQEQQLPSLARFSCFDYGFFLKHSEGAEIRSNWLKKFKSLLSKYQIKEYEKDEPDWAKVLQDKLNVTLQNQQCPGINSSSSKTTSVSKTPSMKTKITAVEKDYLKVIFDSLDSDRYWILESTKKAAAEQQIDPISVDQRVIDFALQCNYYHPSQSLILDLSDNNWDGVFTAEERAEIEAFGRPFLRPINEDLASNLEKMKSLRTAREAYDYARSIEYDPEEQPLLAWLALSLQNTAMLFLKKNNFNIQSYLESDKLYYLWSFVNTIFNSSENIVALGKEKSSTANSSTVNSKRKISAVEPMERMKIGRRTDTVYVANDDIELGCLEIGKANDQTKEWSDGLVKMPVVMRDMLMRMVDESPSLVNEINVIGYSINGNKISLLDMDIPKGYVTRVRRSKAAMYPNNKNNFVVRISPLLELAAIGMQIIEDTFEVFSNTTIPLSSPPISRNPVLPPHSFVPETLCTPSSSATSSSTPNKKRNTNS